MTEEEALTKWCPFARVAGPMHTQAEGTSYNRWPGSDGTTAAILAENDITRCIGSACMAWRWDDVPNPEYDRQRHVFLGGYPPPLTPPMTIKSETEGHCGLAGRP